MGQSISGSKVQTHNTKNRLNQNPGSEVSEEEYGSGGIEYEIGTDQDDQINPIH